MENTAFYIIDSKPAKGMAIDMNLIVHQEDILLALADASIIGRKEDGSPDYDGKLSVICASGLCQYFINKDNSFELDEFILFNL